MILYVIRHGDPIYDPDSLTPLGHRQAEAIAHRLARYGVDRVYASDCIRAQMTAQPTCEILKKEMQIEPWTSENLAYRDFCTHSENPNGWIFRKHREEMHSPEIRKMGDEWYRHPLFDDTYARRGYERIRDASDEFMARHGYVHDRKNFCYHTNAPTEERIAVFCHEGFGVSWLGVLLEIPLPLMWSGFNFGVTGLTVLRFQAARDGTSIPETLTFSNDGHLYRESLPFQPSVRF